ncbi:hypothetical protein [Nocardia sp. NPDC052566]|uniref:hypothetical protein n=1 Tax=Nocardia sp. NPDC052566 TaxID=3364330 RepID=UPI0037C74B0F
MRWSRGVACLVGVALSAVACGDDAPGGGAASTVAISASATTTMSSVALPRCGEVPSKSAEVPADCRLVSGDRAGQSFAVRHDGAPGRTVVTIEVFDRDGARRQTVVERDTRTPNLPTLRDLDDDGRDELVVPLNTGVVNTTYAIYRATDATPEFRRTGELSGLGPEHTSSGYIAIAARDGAAHWDVGFWHFDDAQLLRVATAHIDLTKDSNGKVSGTCAVDPEQAAAQFCAEPLVRQLLPS